MSLQSKWMQRSLVCLLAAAALLLSCAPAATPTAPPQPMATPTRAATPTAAPPAPGALTPAPTATPPGVLPTRAPLPTAPTVEKPKSGGVLFFRNTDDPEHMDIQQQTSVIALQLLAPLHNGLLQYDPLNSSEVIGDLAEKWEASPDGLVYTFHLYKGVKWHDGKPFTSTDVKFTFERAMKPPKGVVTPRWRALADAIESVEAPDPNTFRIRLKDADVSFLAFVASGFSLILPKHVFDERGNMQKNPVGTGPFRFKNYERSVDFVTVKNPDYFVKGQPYLEGYHSYVLPDPGTAIAAFKTGRLDTLWTLPYVSYQEGRELKKELGEKVVFSIGPRLSGFRVLYNTKRAPWDNVLVRRAAYLLADRYEAVDILSEGQGTIGAPIHPQSGWGYTLEELKGKPGYRVPKDQDIAEAKKLLAEAGYPNGFKSSVMTRSLPENTKLAVWATQAFTKAGIDLGEVKVLDSTAGLRAAGAGNFDTHTDGGGMEIADPAGQITLKFLCDSGRNFGKYCNQKVESLYAKIKVELDVAKRKQLVRELEEVIMWEDPAETTVYWSYTAYVWWAYVKGWVPPLVGFNNLKLATVWLAK